MNKTGKPRFVPIAALILLSLLWAFAELRPELLSNLLPSSAQEELPPLARQAMPLFLLAAVSAIFASFRRSKWLPRHLLFEAIAIGFGIFVAPALLVHFAAGWVPPLERAALFTLVPVFSVVFEPYLGGTIQQSRGALPATLIAVTGAFCIFPFAVPVSIEATGALCGVILATAIVGYANCRAISATADSPVAPIAAVASGSAALALVLLSAALETHSLPAGKWHLSVPELLWSASIEMPALLLLFWLIPRLSASILATRYLLAPLLAILLGALVLQLPLSSRTCLGLLLMACGSGYLLLAPKGPWEPPSFLPKFIQK